MKMIALVLVGVVILVGVAIVLAVVDRGYEPEQVDHRDLGLPDRPLRSADIAGLRFRIGLRGYRMDDVDAALDRLTEALSAAEGHPPAANEPTRTTTGPPATDA